MKFIYLVVFLFFVSFVSSIEVGYDNPGLYGIRPSETSTSTSGNGTVNASAINHFDLKPASLLWSVAAHIMDTFLDMDGNNIIDVGTLFAANVEVTQNITLGDSINDDELNSANVTARVYFDSDGVWVISG